MDVQVESVALDVSEMTSEDGADSDEFSRDHCLRHITFIQVRNLSPFPARDTLATALSQRPAVFSIDAGLSSDDTDMLLARRRSRRISSTSVNTLKSLHSDHSHEAPNNVDITPTPSRIRARTGSKSSVQNAATGVSVSAKKHTHNVSSGSTPTAWRSQPRTVSQNPTLGSSTYNSSSFSTDFSSSASGSSWLSYSLTSKDLDKVIWSRLVETFLTVETPLVESQAPQSPMSPPIPKPSAHRKAAPPAGTLSRHAALNNSGSRQSGRTRSVSPSPSARQKRQVASLSSVASTSSTITHSRTSPLSPSGSNTTAVTSPPNSASPRKISFPHSPPPTPPPSLSESSSPVFISRIHRPSTNPKFEFDPQDQTNTSWIDLTANRVIINLWGHVGTEWGTTDGNRKGKERDSTNEVGYEGWKVISSWEFDLSELVPLPDDHVWNLPANTLVITLLPENRAYYLPSTLVSLTPPPSRPHSPEYNSDSEVALSRGRRQAPSVKRLSGEREKQRRSKREVKSAGWNDLFKLVSLQSSLADAQNLLDQAVQTCDDLLAKDRSSILRREASQWEYRLQILQEQRDNLDDDIASARFSIQARREQVKQRRICLAEAKAYHEDDLLSEVDAGVKCVEERKRVVSLKSEIKPMRTSLLSTLAYMFPIELVSPPDLLFTILDVPLPIPMGETDPAPPLSLPSHPDVNEDSVSTALGYAALLVHLMATYLCRSLIYPITYVGSRSLIKDPISAMMGPRMFPLYSKGVDTYRFEYAVFLLNKNIELLMAERDLRAEDFRNTLPNLKNLLLTLTSGESALPRSRPLPPPSISSGLRSPERVSSPSTTPKLTSKQLPSESSSNGASEDGDCAPEVQSTAATVTSRSASGSGWSSSSAGGSSSSSSRRPRSYLGFNVPLSSMFRVRYPSSGGKPSVKSVDGTAETSEDAEATLGLDSVASAGKTDASDAQADEDEDDRRTIRGSTTPVNEVGPNGKAGNGHCRGGSESANEKTSGESEDGQPNGRPVESILST